MSAEHEARLAAVADASGWRDRRDAIVQAALTRLVMAGGGLDVLSMQAALQAAFATAAQHEMDRHGAGIGWVTLSRLASRMDAP